MNLPSGPVPTAMSRYYAEGPKQFPMHKFGPFVGVNTQLGATDVPAAEPEVPAQEIQTRSKHAPEESSAAEEPPKEDVAAEMPGVVEVQPEPGSSNRAGRRQRRP